MRFTTLLVSILSAGLAAAAVIGQRPESRGIGLSKRAWPQNEKFTMTHFSFTKNSDGSVRQVSFVANAQYSPTQMTCSVNSPRYPNPNVDSPCDSTHTSYRFAVHFVSDTWIRVRVYKVVDQSTLRWGEAQFPIWCNKGTCLGSDTDGNSWNIGTTLTIGTPPSFP